MHVRSKSVYHVVMNEIRTRAEENSLQIFVTLKFSCLLLLISSNISHTTVETKSTMNLCLKPSHLILVFFFSTGSMSSCNDEIIDRKLICNYFFMTDDLSTSARLLSAATQTSQSHNRKLQRLTRWVCYCVIRWKLQSMAMLFHLLVWSVWCLQFTDVVEIKQHTGTFRSWQHWELSTWTHTHKSISYLTQTQSSPLDLKSTSGAMNDGSTGPCSA